jgi:hypothetical protein
MLSLMGIYSRENSGYYTTRIEYSLLDTIEDEKKKTQSKRKTLCAEKWEQKSRL